MPVCREAKSAWEGYPDQEEMDVKCAIAMAIRERIEQEGLTQQEAAAFTGVAQADVSAIVNARVWGFSLERLSAILAALGADVRMELHISYSRKKHGSFHIVTAC